jgi:hypothetical protein
MVLDRISSNVAANVVEISISEAIIELLIVGEIKPLLQDRLPGVINFS